jgi:hypothetical protein
MRLIGISNTEHREVLSTRHGKEKDQAQGSKYPRTKTWKTLPLSDRALLLDNPESYPFGLTYGSAC